MAVQKVLRLCACYGSCAAVPFDVILPIWKLAAQQVWKPALRESKGLAARPTAGPVLNGGFSRRDADGCGRDHRAPRTGQF